MPSGVQLHTCSTAGRIHTPHLVAAAPASLQGEAAEAYRPVRKVGMLFTEFAVSPVDQGASVMHAQATAAVAACRLTVASTSMTMT